MSWYSSCRKPIRRAAGWLLAVGTVAGVLAGCGSPGHDASSNSSVTPARSGRDAVAAAYERTTSASSAKLALSVDLIAGATKQSVHVGASGVLDFARGASDLAATLPGGLGAVEVRYLSGVLYAKLPAALARMLPAALAGTLPSAKGDTSWVSVDLSRLSQTRLGESLAQLATAVPSDPAQVLDYLRGAGQDVKDAGPATVDGVATTRYTTTIDLDKAAAALPASARAGVTRFEQSLGTHLLPTQLWIDDQGRLRRMAIIAGQAGLTLSLSDFGTPVHVSAPPADRTTDLTALVAGGH